MKFCARFERDLACETGFACILLGAQDKADALPSGPGLEYP